MTSALANFGRPLAAVSILALSVSMAAAQTPAGETFRVNSSPPVDGIADVRVATSPGSGFMVTWTEPPRRGGGNAYFGRAFSASDDPLGPQFLIPWEAASTPFPVFANNDALNLYAMDFLAPSPSVARIAGWRITAGGTPQGGIFPIRREDPDQEIERLEDVAPIRWGAAWIVYTIEDGRLRALRTRPSGEALFSTDLNLPTDAERRAAAAADRAGNLFVAWGEGAGVFARQVGSLGGWGPLIVVDDEATSRDFPVEPGVAAGPGGRFWVVWPRQDSLTSDTDLYARLFTPEGAPWSSAFRVSPLEDGELNRLSVSSDAAGNLAVLWQTLDNSGRQALRTRLIRPSGPVGAEIPVNPAADPRVTSHDVAFARNGTYVAAWYNGGFEDEGAIFARRLSASPGAEACVVSGRSLRCDTGRTGGAAEVTLAIELQAGDVPLFGDVDGDGRQDPCVRRGRQFLCDTDHEGGAFELSVRFGRGGASEQPLLGDLDDDGRDDPCVRSGRRVSCDTARNGGAAESSIVLAEPRDTASLPHLLGDLNGDGQDDLCAFRAGHFLCTTHRTGLVEEDIAFGAAGDVPFLADWDGDGREDPCVFRAGRFLCDTAHDGGAAEAQLAFGSRRSVPLLGNVDGL